MNLIQQPSIAALAKSGKIVRDVAATASITCLKTCIDDMKACIEKRRPCGIPAETFRLVDKNPLMTTAAWSYWKKSSNSSHSVLTTPAEKQLSNISFQPQTTSMSRVLGAAEVGHAAPALRQRQLRQTCLQTVCDLCIHQETVYIVPSTANVEGKKGQKLD